MRVRGLLSALAVLLGGCSAASTGGGRAASAAAPGPVAHRSSGAGPGGLDARDSRTAEHYDQTRRALQEADDEAHASRAESALSRYVVAAELAQRALGLIKERQASGRWTAGLQQKTRSDGVLTEEKIREGLAKMQQRALARARELAPIVLASLKAELEARGPEQQELLEARGRPEEVKRVKGLTCWVYTVDEKIETCCFARSGKLTSRETVTRAEASAAAFGAWPYSRALSAAMYGHGNCSFGDCAKHGWSTQLPNGQQVHTTCLFKECLKHGWSTTFPDGVQASTTCGFHECMRHGWNTAIRGKGFHKLITCTCPLGDCGQHPARCR